MAARKKKAEKADSLKPVKIVKKKSGYDWDFILRQIPGFDPFVEAGDCRFDTDAAQRALDFFEHPTDFCLTHVKGALAGERFNLENWERAIIANLFGWKRKDGTRRFRECFILVPRKNGKTALAAGIVSYVLFCDGEPGAEIYSAAAEREQATLVFEQVKGMVLNEPLLSSAAKIYTKAITVGGSSYKAISADAASKHGYNSSCIIIDELHAQPNRELVDVLLTSTGARRQPLVIYITTSDYDRPSICNEKYDYACKVRDGYVKAKSNSFLPVIYEAKLEDDWKDPKVWAKANPNLGISVSLEYFETECKKAQEMPSYENTFKRLHLNIKTEQDVRWLPMDKWDKCGAPFDLDTLERGVAYSGLDLATISDLAAWVLIFPELGNAVLPYFWCPEATIKKRSEKGQFPYDEWVRKGFIRVTPGEVVDYDIIRRDINAARVMYNIKEIAIDRWNSNQLQTQLMGDGFDIVPHGMGFASMAAPSKELEVLLTSENLKHNGNPVLRWMASNASAEIDAVGNIKPSRKKSFEKIDGIIGLVMAISRMIVRPKGEGSVYSQRGIITL